MTILNLIIKEGGTNAAFFYDCQVTSGRHYNSANRLSAQKVDEPDFRAWPEVPY